MKKIRKLVLALVLGFAMLAPAVLPMTGTIAVVEAATIKLNKTKVTLDIGKSATLNIPGNKSKVAWKSSDKEIATVTNKGKVTAQSAGTAKITATVNKKKYNCTVTVKEASNPYLVNADFKEEFIDELSIVMPTECDFSVEEISAGTYQALITFEGSDSCIQVIANKTGKKASSYDDVKAYCDTKVSQEILQSAFDASSKTKVTITDFAKFDFASTNGTAYAYAFNIDFSDHSLMQAVYDLSMDGYFVEVSSVDADNADVALIAEYLLNSIMVSK